MTSVAMMDTRFNPFGFGNSMLLMFSYTEYLELPIRSLSF